MTDTPTPALTPDAPAVPSYTPPPPGRAARWLDRLERAGNLLPHPAVLFVALSAVVVVASAIAAAVGLSAPHPATGEAVAAVSLLTRDGLHRMLGEAVRNFTGFAPLGTVLVATLGLAVAEGSGLIRALLRIVVLATPQRWLTFVVVAAGVFSHVASDIGYVLVIPLAAVVFLAAGRHPLAGLAAAFAGVSGGFSANFLLGPTDALLAGITQEGAHVLDPAYSVLPTANFYLMAASAVLITVLGTLVTERVVEPRLGAYRGPETATLDAVAPNERRGLRAAGMALAVVVGLILAGLVPEGGVLRGDDGGILTSPIVSAVVAVIFVVGVVCGLAYGVAAGTMRTGEEVVAAMEASMKTMSLYLVIVFFAAQFIAYFNWTNLGLISAVNAADGLRAAGISGAGLILVFVLVTCVLDLLIGSASAKWALLAPIFVPVFMLLGYSPELAQAAYRIGDSVANIVSPMMAYFPLVVAFAQKYVRETGIGTVVALMAPYSLVFLIGWTALLLAWYALGWPLGPGAPIYYTAPTAP